MRLVVDTNVIMAGLIADSTVRRILSSENVVFYLPEYALDELNKHKKELISKSGIRENDFEALLILLLENIEIVPGPEVKKHMGEAEKIMKEIDIKDTSFVACALAIKADGIWSFDDDFKKQDKIKVFETKELLRYI